MTVYHIVLFSYTPIAHRNMYISILFVPTCPFLTFGSVWVSDRHSGKCRKPLTEAGTAGAGLGSVGA